VSSSVSFGSETTLPSLLCHIQIETLKRVWSSWSNLETSRWLSDAIRITQNHLATLLVSTSDILSPINAKRSTFTEWENGSPSGAGYISRWNHHNSCSIVEYATSQTRYSHLGFMWMELLNKSLLLGWSMVWPIERVSLHLTSQFKSDNGVSTRWHTN